jgi:hypothetical protein
MGAPTYRQPGDDDFLLALGRAVFNYSILEWNVVYICSALDPSCGYPSGSTADPGGKIRVQLAKCLAEAVVSPPLRQRLERLVVDFGAMVTLRNHVLHARPCTTSQGRPGLSRTIVGAPELETAEHLHAIALRFEEVGIEAGAIVHCDELKSDR